MTSPRDWAWPLSGPLRPPSRADLLRDGYRWTLVTTCDNGHVEPGNLRRHQRWRPGDPIPKRLYYRCGAPVTRRQRLAKRVRHGRGWKLVVADV